MKITTTTIIAIASFAFSASARIGETYEQAFERYGQESKIWTDGERSVYQFDKGIFHIAAVFDGNGKIGDIVYIKRDEYGAWTEMSPGEVVKLLQNNKQKGWQFAGQDDGQKYWINGEKLVAMYWQGGDLNGTSYPRLHIYTKEALDKISEASEAEADAAQEGL